MNYASVMDVQRFLIKLWFMYLNAWYKIIVRQKFFKEALPGMSDNEKNNAVGVDIFIAYCAPQLLNATLIAKDAPARFGTRGKTMSEVLGYAQAVHKLTGCGPEVAWMLGLIERNHCMVSIGLPPEEIELVNAAALLPKHYKLRRAVAVLVVLVVFALSGCLVWWVGKHLRWG